MRPRPGDRDHQALAKMAQLSRFTTRDGLPYRLLPLPFASVHVDARTAGACRLPISISDRQRCGAAAGIRCPAG